MEEHRRKWKSDLCHFWGSILKSPGQSKGGQGRRTQEEMTGENLSCLGLLLWGISVATSWGVRLGWAEEEPVASFVAKTVLKGLELEQLTS